MERNDCRRRRVALFALFTSILFSGVLRAQNAPQESSAVVPSSKAVDMQALTDVVQDLRAQVQALNVQLAAVREEAEQARDESRQIRRELDLTRRDVATPVSQTVSLTSTSVAPKTTLPAAAASTSAVGANPQERAPVDRIAQIEENQELMDAKLDEQAQTKIESGSKYRVRLSGIALVNLYSDRGTVANQDYPEVALPPATLDSPGTFGGSLRQSQIGLEAFGPNIAGARTSADIKFDFAGGSPNAPDGVTMGLVRLRTGTVHFDWKDTSIVAGQDNLFFAPLSPRSLASIAVPALSYAGNLWSWVPQVRVEHRTTLSEASSLLFQAGILDSLSGEPPRATFLRSPTWGEESGMPAYATHIAWSHSFFGQTATLGAGGYFGRELWGFNRYVDSWASTEDLTLPLGRLFQLSGEFYRGHAVGGLGGAIGQTILTSGPLSNSSTVVQGLDSIGGWMQLKFKLNTRLEFNGAFGLDNPFAYELRAHSSNTSYYGPLLSKNLSPLVNVIYTARSNILFSLEYHYLRTYPLDAKPATADNISLSLGYLF